MQLNLLRNNQYSFKVSQKICILKLNKKSTNTITVLAKLTSIRVKKNKWFVRSWFCFYKIQNVFRWFMNLGTSYVNTYMSALSGLTNRELVFSQFSRHPVVFSEKSFCSFILYNSAFLLFSSWFKIGAKCLTIVVCIQCAWTCINIS